MKVESTEPVNLPDPQVKSENLNSFRHFSDDFSSYIIGKHSIPIPVMSYKQSKEIRKVATDHDKRVMKTLDGIKNNGIDSSDSILDSEDEFIERIADLVFPKQKDEIFSDSEIARGSLFTMCKDLFIFLVATPARAELLQSKQR
jgi:hypothetical protein